VDEYARTLLLWFGLSGDQIRAVLPNIMNFPADRLRFV